MSQKKYLCMQRSQPTQKEKPSPAQMEEMYAAFMAWRETFKANIVDIGGRLTKGKILTAQGEIDGPFVETKEIIGGYMIISAESFEEAAEIVRGCPGVIGPNSSAELREIAF